MAKLRIPSVQHLARNWRDDPEKICKKLVELAQSPPRFNYNPLFAAVRDLLCLGVPYDQVFQGIRRIKRVETRENLLEVMPLIRVYFDGVSPDFFQLVERRYYPVGRGLMVPFDPPMIFGVSRQLYFPWFSFWRVNPLTTERLSLFVTLVDEILMQDPDLEDARFQILDFSCPRPGSPRRLRIVEVDEIPRVTEHRKRQMLEHFAEGYFRALAALNKSSGKTADEDSISPPRDSLQPGLFD